jgi:hypothetical protein
VSLCGWILRYSRASSVPSNIRSKNQAIDGVPIYAVVDRMFEYSGGPRNQYDQFISVFFLESPALLHASGLASFPDRLTLHVVRPNGSAQNEVIIADPPDAHAPSVYSDSYLLPDGLMEKRRIGSRYVRPARTYRFFSEITQTQFQSVYWPEKSVYYLQFKSNEDESGHSIG